MEDQTGEDHGGVHLLLRGRHDDHRRAEHRGGDGWSHQEGVGRHGPGVGQHRKGVEVLRGGGDGETRRRWGNPGGAGGLHQGCDQPVRERGEGEAHPGTEGDREGRGGRGAGHGDGSESTDVVGGVAVGDPDEARHQLWRESHQPADRAAGEAGV